MRHGLSSSEQDAWPLERRSVFCSEKGTFFGLVSSKVALVQNAAARGQNTELKRCVKVEVAVLGSSPLISLTVSVNVKQS